MVICAFLLYHVECARTVPRKHAWRIQTVGFRTFTEGGEAKVGQPRVPLELVGPCLESWGPPRIQNWIASMSLDTLANEVFFAELMRALS